MTTKSGTYIGETDVQQTDGTIDISASVTYDDATSATVVIAQNTPRITPNVAKPIVVPLGLQSPLTTDADTTYATGAIRVSVTLFE